MRRRPARCARRGFTLVELLVATMLMSMVMVSLTAIFTTGFRFQIQGFHRMVIQNRALLSLRLLERLGGQATYVSSPGLLATSANFSGGINVRPDNPSQPLIAGEPMTFFLFCLGPCPSGSGYTGVCLWNYTGPSLAGINCGASAAPSGGSRELLAAPVITGMPFYRPMNNIIRVDLDIVRRADLQSPETRSSVRFDIRTRLPSR